MIFLPCELRKLTVADCSVHRCQQYWSYPSDSSHRGMPEGQTTLVTWVRSSPTWASLHIKDVGRHAREYVVYDFDVV